MIGRLRLPASTLFLSTLGLPDASLGSFSATIVPHRAPPQSATRTVALPSSVSQVPAGSAANVGTSEAASRTAALVARRRCVGRFMGVPFWVGGLGWEGQEGQCSGCRGRRDFDNIVDSHGRLRWLSSRQHGRLPPADRSANIAILAILTCLTAVERGFVTQPFRIDSSRRLKHPSNFRL